MVTKTIDDYLQSIVDRSKTLEIIPTGFTRIDYVLDGGFMKRELVVIGGSTGSGKSFISGQIAHNAIKQGFKTAYFSLEISGEMIVSRLIGGITNVKPNMIVHNKLGADEDRVDNAKMDLSVYSELLHIYDDVYKLEEITKAITETQYDLVVIDFIQNVFFKGTEYERMSFVALELQRLAKLRNCCILVLSQLSNSAVKDKTVEYKGSGGIAMVADLGFFIVKDEHGNTALSLKKNRRGVSGFLQPLKFTVPGGRIYEI